jgi:hypothetical protein
MPTTFRSDYRTALATLLDGFKAANPTLVQHVYRARPGSFHPPLAYVGTLNEPAINFTSGTRRRLIRAQFALVQGLYDNAETADRMDVLADAFIDYLTANPHAINSRSVLTPISAEDVELVIPPAGPDKPQLVYAATLLTVESDLVEGRL